jgi:Ca2+-binding EF-hand superfamily protein
MDQGQTGVSFYTSSGRWVDVNPDAQGNIFRSKAPGRDEHQTIKYKGAPGQGMGVTEEELRRPDVSFDKIIDIMQEKLYRRTEGGAMTLRSIFRIYDKNKCGKVSRFELNLIMQSFGLPLKDPELDALYAKYDPRNTGEFEYGPFIDSLIPDDYNMKDLYQYGKPDAKSQALDKRFAPKDLQSHNFSRIPIKYYDTEVKRQSFKTEDILIMLSDKLYRKVQGGPMQLRAVFRLMDADKSGKISRQEFLTTMGNFGISLKEAEMDDIFAKFDPNGDGHFDYYEFIQGLLQPDYTGEFGTTKFTAESPLAPGRADMLQQRNQERRCDMSAEHIEDLLITKMMTKTKGGPMTLRGYFRAQDRDHTGFVTKEQFGRVVHGLGLWLKDHELTSVWDRHAVNEKLPYLEFILKILPLDYTEEMKNFISFQKPQPIEKTISEAHHVPASNFKAFGFNVSQVEDLMRTKLMLKVNGQQMAMRKVFSVVDTDHLGTLSFKRFQQALHDIGLSLEDEPVMAVCNKHDSLKDGQVDYFKLVSGITGKDFVRNWKSNIDL